MFRNERTFYKRRCDLCKRNIIATYPAEAPHPVYCLKCWWSDDWDPLAYGRDFDFSRPFFEQFKELLKTVPALSVMNDDGIASTNCEYTYDWFYSKNCYMATCGWHAENCMYTYHGEYIKDVLDCTHTSHSELCYECLFGNNLSRCLYCVNCRDSQDCVLSQDLQGCSHCVMCIGLRNKSYCIRNKQYTKEQYLREISALRLDNRDSLEKYRGEFERFALKFPRRHANILKSFNATGDFLVNCKNSQNCFLGGGLENCKFIVVNAGGKDSYDFNMTGEAELCYECVTSDHGYAQIGTVFCFKSRYVEYSHYCPSAEWCLGCVGLKKGSYSIFNKKYSQESFDELRTKIVEHMKKTGEWGEFFPHWVSPHAYNETAAQEWLPLTRKEAEAQGYEWREPELRNYEPTMKPADLPDTITGVQDEILNEIIQCDHNGNCNEKCTGAFRIVLPELQLYRRLGIPLPRICPNCRHYVRIAKRNPPRLWHRKCMCDYQVFNNFTEHTHHETGACPNEFETTYAPDRPEIVYCEPCYQAETT